MDTSHASSRKNLISECQLQTFRALFVAREDAHAVLRGNQPVAVREPLSDKVLAAHFAGECRAGTYLIKLDGKTPFLALDVDVQKKKLVKRILKRLRKRKVKAYVERSKSKGFHIWIFFDKPLRAIKPRQYAKLLLRGLDASKIEVFPKQDEVREGGLGNCIWLPLFGRDVSEDRTVFLDRHFAPLDNQWSLLQSIRRTPRKLIIEACRQTEPEAKEFSKSSNSAGEPITEGERNTTLPRLAGAMRHQGASTEAILAALLKQNRECCRPPLADKEVESIAASVSKYPPAEQRKDGKRIDLMVRDLLGEEVIFFHTPDKEAYVKIKHHNHREVWRMHESTFKRYMSARFYKKFGAMPRSQDLNDTPAALEGIAFFDAPEQAVFTRVAQHDGAIYFDLCDSKWQVVEITERGWRVLSESPVNFRRARGMKALPLPETGRSVAALRSFLNLERDEDFVIVTSWLVAALRPKGPYPVLVLQGEAGSAKSTAVRVLRELIDPNTTPLRSEPRETRDLMIAARNSWCICFDNVSHLTWRLSDDLCRLATGGGFSTRQLYTDSDEMLFDATRPLILNGIDAVVRRGDLLDRSLITYLPVIPDHQRKPEKKFWEHFRKAQPKLLGALLDAVSYALRRLESVKLPELPRMADFAQWMVAAEEGLGWSEGTFLRAYDSNRGTANALSLEASPVVAPLKRLLAARSSWRGTAAELLQRLKSYADDDASQQRNWPKNAQTLSIELRRIAPNLRASGFDVQFGEKTSGIRSKRIITIKRIVPEREAARLAKYDRPNKEPPSIRRFPRPYRFPRL